MLVDNDQEKILLERAAAGSESARVALLQAHQERLFRFLVSRAKSQADAEDALQECLINAYRYFDSYSPKWQFSTWLYRIALRELGKIASKSREQPGTGVPEQHAPDPLQDCIRDDDRQNLWLTARHCLSAAAFTALWLRYAEDLPVRDVAHAMGRPQTWVKVTVHRARKRLIKAHENQPGRNERQTSAAKAGETTSLNCETAS